MPSEPVHHREIPEGFEPDDIPAPLRAFRGRGAVQNPTGRYEAAEGEARAREVGPLFDGWLQAWLPERRERVLSLLRGARGGELYDSRFGVRMRGEGPYAALLAQRFELTRRRLGLPSEVPPLTTALFQHLRPVATARAPARQMELI
ncbi:MAG: hypothetical protein H6747_09335 [Deltaproteobacteria bacterium]|nr:hypothetical protein [Deltaproteobacteria bacterium]